MNNSKWVSLFSVISHKLSSFLVLGKGDSIATLQPQLNILTVFIKLCIDFPSIKECAWCMNIFFTTCTKMKITHSRVTVSAFKIVRSRNFVIRFRLEFDLPFTYCPKTIHQHAKYVDSLELSCWNSEQTFQTAVIAFAASYFIIWIYSFMVTALTNYIFFLSWIYVN